MNSQRRYKEISAKISTIFRNDFENIAAQNSGFYESMDINFSKDPSEKTMAKISAYALKYVEHGNAAKKGRYLGVKFKLWFID